MYNRPAKGLPTSTVVLLAVIIIGGGGYLAYQNNLFNQSSVPSGGGGPTCLQGYVAPSNFQCVNSATVSLSLTDPLATGAISSATVTIYNPDGTGGSDSGTTSASGAYSSALKYSTGQQIVILISKTNYLTFYQPITVPPAQSSASPPTSLTVPIFDTSLGAWSNTVIINPGGSTVSTGQTYYFSEQATAQTSVQVSWTLTETTNNAGWVNSNDIFNHFTRNLVFVASDGGDGIQSITGYQTKEIGGTTNYYLFTIPSGVTARYAQDDVTLTGWTVAPTGATQYTNSNSQTSTGGTYGFSFNMNRNSETAGTLATWSFKLWYAASATFSPNGSYNLGPPATQTGSTFTIKMVA